MRPDKECRRPPHQSSLSAFDDEPITIRPRVAGFVDWTLMLVTVVWQSIKTRGCGFSFVRGLRPRVIRERVYLFHGGTVYVTADARETRSPDT